MTDQYWVLPVGGVEWGYRVSGIPVAQLPDTSGMVEVEVKVSGPITRLCHPADPESGEGEWCEVKGEVSTQVLTPAEPGLYELIGGYLHASSEASGGTFGGVAVFINISPRVWSYRYSSYGAIPPTTRLYVAFDAPTVAGELRTVRCKVADYGALVLTADVPNPTPTLVNLRVFITHEARPEFWTTFVNAAEIV